MPFRRKAFTLIELLVVIAIIAILAVVVVLTLNPAQLLAQSRDANRVSDMATLNSAINLYSTDQSGASSYSLGSTSTAYLSLPASTTNCSALGMATSGYSYDCSNASNYRNASSSGWLPINFQNISSGAPFGSLPVDPVNQSSSNLYYAYETNGSQYVLSSFMESQKYAKNMQTTGGIDPALYEIGSGASTLPNATRGLVGYWPLNEGTGNSAIDWSGEGNNGTWSGSQVGTSGYYSPGKVFQWAGMFDGTSTKVLASSTGALAGGGPMTVAAWVEATTSSAYATIVTHATSNLGWNLTLDGSTHVRVNMYNGSSYTAFISSQSIIDGTWHFLLAEYDGTKFSLYIDGALSLTANLGPGYNAAGSSVLSVGFDPAYGRYWNGFISDLRVYDRALSAAEIQQLYNAEK